MVQSEMLTLSEAIEVCSSLDVCSFLTSYMSRRCAHGGIVVSQPLLGRFNTELSFLHIDIMALTVVCWNLRP